MNELVENPNNCGGEYDGWIYVSVNSNNILRVVDFSNQLRYNWKYETNNIVTIKWNK